MGSVFGGGGGGGTTTQRTELDPLQRKTLGSLLAKSEAQYDNPVMFFPGQTLADEDPLIGQGQSQALGAAGRIGSQTAATSNAIRDAMEVDLVNDPRTNELADAATQPIWDNFSERIAPQISSGASAAGAFGGTRQGLMTAAAGRETARAVGETRANVISDAYRAQLQQRMQAAGMLPMLNTQQLLPAQITQNVGEQRTMRGQQEIDADRERFEFNQFEPESRLDRFASRVAGVNLGGLTTAKSTTSGGGLFGK